MFRVIDTDETPNMIVSKNTKKDRAISEAIRKYYGVKAVLTIQKQNPVGRFETVGALQTK